MTWLKHDSWVIQNDMTCPWVMLMSRGGISFQESDIEWQMKRQFDRQIDIMKWRPASIAFLTLPPPIQKAPTRPNVPWKKSRRSSLTNAGPTTAEAANVNAVVSLTASTSEICGTENINAVEVFMKRKSFQPSLRMHIIIIHRYLREISSSWTLLIVLMLSSRKE